MRNFCKFPKSKPFVVRTHLFSLSLSQHTLAVFCIYLWEEELAREAGVRADKTIYIRWKNSIMILIGYDTFFRVCDTFHSFRFFCSDLFRYFRHGFFFFFFASFEANATIEIVLQVNRSYFFLDCKVSLSIDCGVQCGNFSIIRFANIWK